MTCTSASPRQGAVAILVLVSVISRFSRGRLLTHGLLNPPTWRLGGLFSIRHLIFDQSDMVRPVRNRSPSQQTTENITMVALHQINVS